MIDLRRLKLSPLTSAGLVGFVWFASGGVVRDFVISEFREGKMRLHGLSPLTRAAARLGFVLLAIMVAALAFNEAWRGHSALIAMTTSSAVRGQLVPVALLPLTVFMLVVAWSFALAGALHCHWVLRLAVLLIYAMNAIAWINSILTGATSGWEFWSAVTALGATVLFVAGRWRAQPRPGLELPVLFGLVSVIFLLAQRHEVLSQQNTGIPLALAKLSFNVLYLSGLITPLLLLIGLDIADFAVDASQWTVRLLTERAAPLAIRLLLAALFGWRFHVAAQEFQAYSEGSWRAYAGAFGEVAVVAAVYALVSCLRPRKRPTHAEIDQEEIEEAAESAGLSLVLAYSLVPLATFLLLGLGLALPTRGPLALQSKLFPIVDFLTEHAAYAWQKALSVLALVAAFILMRRGNRGLALYLGTFGSLEIWDSLTRPAGYLGALTWRGQELTNGWWLLLVTAAALVSLVRGNFDARRKTEFLLLLLLLTLIRQRHFIENPFSPFFGFAGIAFMAFALGWDATTRGSWANVGTPALPRVGRVFLYLGYVLLAATVLNWAVTTHDIGAVEKLTGGTALIGFDRFGKPLLYTLMLLILSGGAKDLETDAAP